ncbi:hypothetical protein WR25_09105 [Diploscapter pachys]|uniref:Uncharacterized protein n=1 Tax=Diploscapter pachys TaxID=2018661 RepID=A0A2A2LPC9_9BILA|nr:hypothetical protein WR25_09105 [Diploscapter pachys]
MFILIFSESDMAPPTKKYQQNDKVLCSHGQYWYLAKIVDVQDEKSDNPVYTIHYQGWKKTHDEKIPHSETPERFKEYSEDALKEATEQQKQGSQAASKKRPRKSENEIDIPHTLRKILIDDNDCINRQFKVHKLPVRYTVQDILDEYAKDFETRGIKKEAESDITEGESVNDQVLIIYENGEITASAYKFILGAEGIKDYFNTLLPYQLLYKFERPQYQEVSKGAETKGRKSQEAKPKLPSDIYGIVHLLRLFSRLGSVLKLTPWDSKVRSIINEVCRDFLVFMETHKDRFFDVNKDYQSTTSEYQKQVWSM